MARLTLAAVVLGGLGTAATAQAATPEFVADIEYRLAWDRARAAIDAEQWPRAEQILRQLDSRKPDDAQVLTLLAYTRRHQGFLTEARDLYVRALRLDPDSLDAHEYAGEAALLMNDAAAASSHLQALRRLCANGCEQLDDLQAAFAAWQQRAGGAPASVSPKNPPRR